MTEVLERIAYRAKADPACRFTALAHHLTEDFLRDTWQVCPERRRRHRERL